MHYNCLIVDDEIELAKMTAEYFRMFDVSTEYVDSAASCLTFFEEGNTTDLVLLDINLGDGSGFDVCKKLREDMQLPILFISARQSDDDVLIALSIGGDDYIKKPYSLSILLAKVKVNLKRIAQMKEATTSGDAASASDNGDEGASPSKDFIMDYPTMSVIIKGNSIPLKAKEYALLNCLYQYKGTIVKKEVLFDEVWGDTFFSDSTLNVHIRKLREKIEENPNEPKLIKTVWGTGYILELS
ncbi:DNA-binding response regulator [Butyrivibrio sp. CB08]|uniref:response regulator transcription factor n=1 Tax=Butyrivibrio sp. CB08 TaxID=2364879 RepID=UPI000EAA7D62|nr:response regulator transcription factor [Butyrivibrio sp. CB08]RKM62218.1 DNA-binding response regulator [Butyrivibrio sp. CB08]